MKNLLLIGGGSIAPYELKEFDEEIVKMTKKEKPVFLFIGLASTHSDSKYDTMKVIYQNLGCETLYLKKKNIINNPDIVKNKIDKADIIYMCGGDTSKLVNTLKEYKIDELLLTALNRGCVLAGISAGAIALANSGLSDSLILNNKSEHYAFTPGLSFINITICPHGNCSNRINDLKLLLKKTNEKVLILDNGVALKVENEKFSIIKNIQNATARIAYYKNNIYTEEEIDKNFILQ